jgi:hypothetical protein
MAQIRAKNLAFLAFLGDTIRQQGVRNSVPDRLD